MQVYTNYSRSMHLTLWVMQVVLSANFILIGIMKFAMPVAELQPLLPWVKNVPVGLVRFIGVAEFLCALGLVLPSLLKIKPMLTPIAALGIGIIMHLAIVYHYIHGEFYLLSPNIAFGSIAFFVAWGRCKKAPIYPR